MTFSRRFLATSSLAIAGGLTLGALAAQAEPVSLDKGITVSGGGSTFVSNFVDQCRADLKTELGANVAYQGIGSGAGRSGFIAGTLDFGGSDVAFTTAELPNVKNKFVYIAFAAGGIAVTYKLPGVTELKFTAPTLAKIFAGSILKWNDEAIAKENPGVNLPSEVIRVVVRSDSSGTSNVFSDYLSSAGKGGWTKGAQSTFPVPAGNGIAQKGSDGVTNYLAGDQGNYSITYAESSFATERKLSIAKIVNTAGNAVTPDPANVSEAVAAAAVNDDGTLLLNFNATAAKAYPISTTAYLIASQTMDKAKGDVLRTFLTYGLNGCQKKAEKIGYAPLPANLVKLGMDAVAKINPGSGDVPTIGSAAAAPTTVAAATATTAAPAATAAPTTKKATVTTKKKTTKTTKKK